MSGIFVVFMCVLFRCLVVAGVARSESEDESRLLEEERAALSDLRAPGGVKLIPARRLKQQSRAVTARLVQSCEAAGRCLICRDELTGVIIDCSSCRTPHHKDCWNYNGRCAVYGCDQSERND